MCSVVSCVIATVCGSPTPLRATKAHRKLILCPAVWEATMLEWRSTPITQQTTRPQHTVDHGQHLIRSPLRELVAGPAHSRKLVEHFQGTRTGKMASPIRFHETAKP